MADLTALSLFAGAGGMDLGVRQAGFKIVAAIDKDIHCYQTLCANALPNEHPIHQDISEMDPLQLVDTLAIDSVDLLIGGPPCQSFSQIGKREGIADERGMLLFQMERFATFLRPRAVLIEQVKGLINTPSKSGQRGEIFSAMLNGFETLGYKTHWQIINAADFGVPQRRERVFIVATRPEVNFKFPQPTHTDPLNCLPLFPLPTYCTVGDAIGDLQPPTLHGTYRYDSHIDITPAGDRRRIHGVPSGDCLVRQHHLPQSQRGRLTSKDTTKFRRLAFDLPSITLRGGEIFFHPIEDRYLTPREYLRIQGFPDDYYLLGPIRGRSGQIRALDQHRQAANAVPPPVAYALAVALREALLCPASLNYSVIP